MWQSTFVLSIIIADAVLAFIRFYNRWLGVEGKLLKLPPPQLETRLLKGGSCPSYQCSLLTLYSILIPTLHFVGANLAERLEDYISSVVPLSGCLTGQLMDLIAQILMVW